VESVTTTVGLVLSREEKGLERWCRRAAARQGLSVARSRRRDPLALDYGLYRVTDQSGAVAFEGSLSSVATWLSTPPAERRH
jgi:hypothetical protein